MVDEAPTLQRSVQLLDDYFCSLPTNGLTLKDDAPALQTQPAFLPEKINTLIEDSQVLTDLYHCTL